MNKAVELVLESPVTDLIHENNRVTGVVVKGNAQITANNAVIIAAGGFEHNKAMREQYLPQPATTGNSSGVTTNTGDLIQAAEKIGAKLGLMDEAWWAPTAMT